MHFYLNFDSLSFISLIGCATVSGPSPSKPCKFPFTFKGVTYSGCPIDPDDSSKRWCSTLVDEKGNHVVDQKEYGHCSDTCPIHGGTNSNNNNGPGNDLYMKI